MANPPAGFSWMTNNNNTTTQQDDPRSYSTTGGSTKLPTWAEDYLKKWVGGYDATNPFQQYQNSVNAMSNSEPLNTQYQNYMNSINALNDSDKYIEQQRQLMNQQWARDIQSPMRNVMGNNITAMMGKGTLGSSMSGDWMRQFSNEMGQASAAQQNKSNQWAADQKLKALVDRITANQGGFSSTLGWQEKQTGANQSYAAMLADLLGLSKSTSQSSKEIGALPGDFQTENPG